MKQHIPEQTIGQKINNKKNFKNNLKKQKWKDSTLKFMRCSKNISKKVFYNNKGLHQEKYKISKKS